MSPAVTEAPVVAEAPQQSMVERLTAMMTQPAVSAVPDEPGSVAATEAAPEAEEEFQLEGLEEDAPPAVDPAPAEQPPAEAATDPDQEIGALLATPRGRRIYAAHKAMRELSELPEKGGIGFTPTANDIKEFHAAQQDWRMMQQDFSTPEPVAQERFLGFWFGPNQNGQPRPGTEELVEKLPVYLNERNPEAFRRLSQPMYEGLALRFMELSKQSADPAEQDLLAKAADLISRDQLGRPLVTPSSQPSQASSLPPEIQRELDEARRLKASLQQQQQTSTQRAQTAFLSDIDSRGEQQLIADVDKALEAAKGVKEANPFMYEAARDRLVSQLKDHLSRNHSGMARVDYQKQRALQTMDPQMVGSVVQERRRLYADPLRQLRGEALKALGVTLKAQAAVTTDQRNQSAGKTAPASSFSMPSSANNPANPTKLMPNESNRARLERIMKAGTGAA